MDYVTRARTIANELPVVSPVEYGAGAQARVRRVLSSVPITGLPKHSVPSNVDSEVVLHTLAYMGDTLSTALQENRRLQQRLTDQARDIEGLRRIFGMSA